MSDEKMTTAAEAPAPETPGFRDAIEELEEILARIEGEETDIDRLGEELRRAAFLLEVCRGKIRKAEVEVTQIVQALEAKGEPARADGAE
jgi:exodeoxyribonuclease VII small subunit